MNQVITEIVAERARQDQKWGGPAHDDTHDWKDWARWIEDRAVAIRRLGPLDPQQARKNAIEIAALAVAFTESLDRAQATYLPRQIGNTPRQIP